MSDEIVRVPAALVEDLRRAMRYVDVKDSLLAREDQEDAFKCARAVVDAAERPDEGRRRPDHDVRCASHDSASDCDCRPVAPVGEPLCECGQCGHPETAHSFHLSKCLMIDACSCTAFTPAPLSSPRRTRDEGTEDEAEAAWQAWRDEAEDDTHTVELTSEAFIAGFRAARLAGEDDR